MMRKVLLAAVAMTMLTGAAVAKDATDTPDCKPATLFQLFGIDKSACDAASTTGSIAQNDVGSGLADLSDGPDDQSDSIDDHGDKGSGAMHSSSDDGEDDSHDGGSHDSGSQSHDNEDD